MAKDYDRVDEEAFYFNQYRAYRRHLEDHRRLISGAVLDLGCGTGIQIDLARRLATSVIGIDLSMRLLGEAQRKLPTVGLCCADACQLPFASNSFDTVISYGEVLSHIPSYLTAFQEASRVLKPRGHFLFSLLNKWNIRTILDPIELLSAVRQRTGHWRKWSCIINPEGDLIEMDLKTFAGRELRDLSAHTGFELLSIEGLHISSLLVPLAWQYGAMNIWGRAFTRLGRIDALVSGAKGFRGFGYTKLIVARKR